MKGIQKDEDLIEVNNDGYEDASTSKEKKTIKIGNSGFIWL